MYIGIIDIWLNKQKTKSKKNTPQNKKHKATPQKPLQDK